jgi:prepilin-type processing-associated H-X9-DG protein
MNADLHYSFTAYNQLDPKLGQEYSQAGLVAPASTILLAEVQGATYGGGGPAPASEPFGNPLTQGELYSPAVTGGYDPSGGGYNVPEGSFTYGTFYATGPTAGYSCVGGSPSGSSDSATTLQCASNFLTGVHTDGANYLCCDGHVKWVRGSQVTGGMAAKLPTNSQLAFVSGVGAYASGTSALTDLNGNHITLTFSPV